jgi:hypothetical protein
MTKTEIGRAVCGVLGERYAERLFEKWKNSRPEEKRRQDALNHLKSAVREMYFSESGVYVYPDRTFLNERTMDLIGDCVPGAQLSNGADICLEADIKTKPKSDVETFGDLMELEVVPCEGRIAIVTRQLPDHLFE